MDEICQISPWNLPDFICKWGNLHMKSAGFQGLKSIKFHAWNPLDFMAWNPPDFMMKSAEFHAWNPPDFMYLPNEPRTTGPIFVSILMNIWTKWHQYAPSLIEMRTQTWHLALWCYSSSICTSVTFTDSSVWTFILFIKIYHTISMHNIAAYIMALKLI